MNLLWTLIPAMLGTVFLAFVFRRGAKAPKKLTHIDVIPNIVHMEEVVGDLESEYKKASRELSVAVR
jgi:hypothetical protein